MRTRFLGVLLLAGALVAGASEPATDQHDPGHTQTIADTPAPATELAAAPIGHRDLKPINVMILELDARELPDVALEVAAIAEKARQIESSGGPSYGVNLAAILPDRHRIPKPALALEVVHWSAGLAGSERWGWVLSTMEPPSLPLQRATHTGRWTVPRPADA